MKNKSVLLLIVLISLFFITNCKKEKVKTPLPTEIVAGTGNSNLTITDINPDTILNSFQEVETYDIDVNNDNIKDFRLSGYNNYIQGGAVNSDAQMKIEALSADSYVLADSIYPFALNSGESIDISGSWKQGSLTLLRRTCDCCPPTPFVYEGAWKDKTGNYIGIRYQNRLGWIKVGIEQGNMLQLFEYALVNQP